jgi:hypothetical protein
MCFYDHDVLRKRNVYIEVLEYSEYIHTPSTRSTFQGCLPVEFCSSLFYRDTPVLRTPIEKCILFLSLRAMKPRKIHNDVFPSLAFHSSSVTTAAAADAAAAAAAAAAAPSPRGRKKLLRVRVTEGVTGGTSLLLLAGTLLLLLLLFLLNFYGILVFQTEVLSSNYDDNGIANFPRDNDINNNKHDAITMPVTSTLNATITTATTIAPTALSTCPLLRNCSNNNNSNNRNFVYLENGRRAGLRDMITIMTFLGTLAESVCAKLILPPPHAALLNTHNHKGHTMV